MKLSRNIRLPILFLLATSLLGFSSCKKNETPLCFYHVFTKEEVTKLPTCVEKGEKTKTCTNCGKTEVEYFSDPNAHAFSDWKVTKEATFSEVGIKIRICSLCNKIETEEIDRLTLEDREYVVSDYYGGYYSSIVSWENGEDLKNQLHALIRNGFTGLSYDGNWETNQMTEQSLTNFEEVNVIYSQKDDKKTNTYGGAAGAAGWQREHAFCASLMTAYNTGEAVNILSSGTSRATDFHNLFASYGAANGSRGNKNFGVYDPATAITESAAVDADTRSDLKNYEPNDCDKGKLARAIFYMGVMYSEEESSNITVKYNYKNASNDSSSKNVTVAAKYKPLQIVENYVDYSQIAFTDFVSASSEAAQNARNTYLTSYKEDTSAYSSNSPLDSEMVPYSKAYSDYRYAEGSFAIGNLSTLIDWNLKPVDRQEMWHNETVYSYVHKNGGPNKGKKQGNRNPFVDYPGLVDYVYGSKKDEPGLMNKIHPSQELIETNKNEVYNYALTSHKSKYLVGETLSSADYTFVKVNKDFTTEASDFTDTNESYTFVESDIGTKKITLTTPTGTVSYYVTVESAGGVNACNYNFIISKESFSSTKIQTEYTQMLSYGGVKYNVKAGIANCPVAKKDTYAQIGNGTQYVPSTVTFETVDAFSYDNKSNISAVYLGLNTASDCTYNYKIYVGDEEAAIGTFTYSKAGPVIYGKDLDTPKTGKLKIVLSSCKAAVYISQISVRVN